MVEEAPLRAAGAPPSPATTAAHVRIAARRRGRPPRPTHTHVRTRLFLSLRLGQATTLQCFENESDKRPVDDIVLASYTLVGPPAPSTCPPRPLAPALRTRTTWRR